MFRKLGKVTTNLFTALGMLALLLVVLFYVLKFAGQAPVIGGPATWVGQHASGSAEGF